jgi:ABC-type sugar transport system, permease component
MSVNIMMVIFSIFCLFPLILLLVSSFTAENMLIREGYSFIPRQFSMAAYKYLFQNASVIIRAYLVTVVTTAVGTMTNLILTTLLAYPLSKRDLPHRNVWSFIVFFTMLFNGGTVASYILWSRYFHIKNTYLALIVPNLLMGAFYVMMMRTFFTQNIPEESLEAARLDGAGEWYILRRIVIPMSKPIIATLALLVGLQYWNDWINGLYFLTKDKYFSIQVLLNNMLQDMRFLTTISSSVSGKINQASMPSLSIKMAIAVIGVLPVLIIYPFTQKYFIKGITIGAVKG